MTPTERRANPRYPIAPGSFAYYALGSGVIQNLSLGGVFIEDRDASFSAGTEIDLELRLDNESVVLRGAVRRVEPQSGFAVEFLELAPEVRHRLEKHFRARFGSARG